MTSGPCLTCVVRTRFRQACPIIGAALLGAAIGTANCGGGGATPVRGFSRAASASPQWNTAPISPGPAPAPESVDIYLDTSLPMAGFLPPASRPEEPSVLRTVAQNAGSHLSRVYGGGVSLRWHAVGNDLRNLQGTPRIESRLFNDGQSRIVLTIERILADFRNGRSEAAALVTDLTATGDVTGPLAVSNALADWLASDAVRSGTFHVGLLGAKADYRGYHSRRCPERADQLGCVHSERTGTVTRLAEVVQMPLYVLLLGRDAERVADVLESVGRGIEELSPDIEVKREVLTRRSGRAFDLELSCDAGEQFALFVNDLEQSSCLRDETVTLSCRFADLPQLTAATATIDPGGAPATWSGAAVVRGIAEGGFELDVDCGALRRPSEPVRVRLDEVEGSIAHAWDVDWSPWSTETDELGKTLQLEGFVRELRIVPDLYRIELRQPILEFAAQ